MDSASVSEGGGGSSSDGAGAAPVGGSSAEGGSGTCIQRGAGATRGTKRPLIMWTTKPKGHARVEPTTTTPKGPSLGDLVEVPGVFEAITGFLPFALQVLNFGSSCRQCRLAVKALAPGPLARFINCYDNFELATTDVTSTRLLCPMTPVRALILGSMLGFTMGNAPPPRGFRWGHELATLSSSLSSSTLPVSSSLSSASAASAASAASSVSLSDSERATSAVVGAGVGAGTGLSGSLVLWVNLRAVVKGRYVGLGMLLLVAPVPNPRLGMAPRSQTCLMSPLCDKTQWFERASLEAVVAAVGAPTSTTLVDKVSVLCVLNVAVLPSVPLPFVWTRVGILELHRRLLKGDMTHPAIVTLGEQVRRVWLHYCGVVPKPTTARPHVPTTRGRDVDSGLDTDMREDPAAVYELAEVDAKSTLTPPQARHLVETLVREGWLGPVWLDLRAPAPDTVAKAYTHGKATQDALVKAAAAAAAVAEAQKRARADVAWAALLKGLEAHEVGAAELALVSGDVPIQAEFFTAVRAFRARLGAIVRPDTSFVRRRLAALREAGRTYLGAVLTVACHRARLSPEAVFLQNTHAWQAFCGRLKAACVPHGTETTLEADAFVAYVMGGTGVVSGAQHQQGAGNAFVHASTSAPVSASEYTSNSGSGSGSGSGSDSASESESESEPEPEPENASNSGGDGSGGGGSSGGGGVALAGNMYEDGEFQLVELGALGDWELSSIEDVPGLFYD